MTRTKPALHCWENGPLTDDGMPTTCMREDGHAGTHKWLRDDEIRISITPAPAPKRRKK